ncbi:unnamed protein product [Linum trigynum]|uniref:Small subunit processome component 20 homolog n=1 Tax=Linum trigynum TaxID=586398 RepID=A0AAV2CCC0_9ROSI
MATPSHAVAVKSLNQSAGRGRFVFKSFSQKIEGLEVNVFRSLDRIKQEPSYGTFFNDCLKEWRELNTAEDFITLYDEMSPLVQSSKSLALHKEFIVSALLSRLQMQARLSLEPILRLTAALSRDLLEDFIVYLPRVVRSLVSLLESGADQDPDILEQIFTTWSYILMYLQGWLTMDIVGILKVSQRLRYYPKEYVRRFMAEATSFLLRNAPHKQLEQGVKEVIGEAVDDPSLARNDGVSALLYYSTKVTSSSLHSKAERILQLLIGDLLKNHNQDSVVDVVSSTIQRLCKDQEIKELNFLWDCLYNNMDCCVRDMSLVHLSRILALLVSMVQINKGRHVPDYQPMLKCVGSVVDKFIKPFGAGKEENDLSGIVDNLLQLMLCILDGLKSLNDECKYAYCSLQWGPVFNLKTKSCLEFISGLMEKDLRIVQVFQVGILRAMNNLIELYQVDLVHLLLCLCERLQNESPGSTLFDGTSGPALCKIHDFLVRTIKGCVAEVNGAVCGQSCTVDTDKLPLVWGAMCCYPHVSGIRADANLIMQLMDSLKALLMNETENIAGADRQTWQSLVGAALSCYIMLSEKPGPEKTSYVLETARAHKASPQVLAACADCLDVILRDGAEAETSTKILNTEFVDNLSNPDKNVRLSTLKILCHCEVEGQPDSSNDQPPAKKMKIEAAQSFHVDKSPSNALQLLRTIEETPLSSHTSRKVVLLISAIQTDLVAERISKTYLPVVLSGMIGILHNGFSHLWNPASECLAVLINKNVELLWDQFLYYFQHFQTLFLKSQSQQDGVTALSAESSSDLSQRFHSFVTSASERTLGSSVLPLLLQSIKRIPCIVEARSRSIVPLFLNFLGYNDDDLKSVGSFNPDACRRKEWKGILKEWLNLMKLMKNPKALYRTQFVKDILCIRLMDDNDVNVQMDVLDCLLTWKDEFLVPYQDHLRNLISPKTLREELTTWSISRESCPIDELHRPNLVPLIIVLLMPKVTNLRSLASRKHASLRLRKEVLRFMAQLDINEISLFYASLVKRLDILPRGVDDAAILCWTAPENSMHQFEPSNFLKYFTNENILGLSWDKRYGFVHVIEAILEEFDELHIRPFLNLLMGCVARLLVSCSLCLGAPKGAGETDQSEEEEAAVDETPVVSMTKEFKHLRSLCLKIVSGVLNKYYDHDFGCEFWDMFFSSVKPLISSFKHQGSSSEKPSSLFSCFVAMSKSHNLVSLLCRENSLVPSIFSILSVRTASEAIVSHVLAFIENLLILDQEYVDEDDAIKRVLLPNLKELISSLHSLLKGDEMTKRKWTTSAVEVVVGILKSLSKYVNDFPTAQQFLTISLQLLAARVKDSDACIKCLQIVRETIQTVPLLGNQSTREILNCVSPLFISAKLDVRVSVCDLLGALAKTDPSLLFLAELLLKLNSTIDVDDLDYDNIVRGYETIGVEFFYGVKEYHAIIVLSQCVGHMSSDELIVRHSAYRAMRSFVEFSAQFLGELKDKGEAEEAVVSDEEGSWTSKSIRRMINKFILNQIGKAMKAGSTVRKEWIELLRDMVLKLPEVSNLGSFRALCSEDADQDFFKNIIHLQKHMRAKALTRFKSKISGSSMSEGIINKVFMPLFFNMMLDVQVGKGEHMKGVYADALASISAHVGWKSYYSLLLRCFQEMDKKLDKQKILLRLACSVLDNFHFSHASSTRGVEEYALEEAEIQECLQKVVLPRIQKLLGSDSDKVNVTISVVSLKVLKLLPGDRLDAQLPSIIHRIANHLKSHMVSIRDEARVALAACLKELGPEYLQLIVKVLQGTLKRGYELHVLGYTLHFLLSKLLSTPESDNSDNSNEDVSRSGNATPLHATGRAGNTSPELVRPGQVELVRKLKSPSPNVKLDYCIEDLLQVVEKDILGDVAEEKEVDKIASKMKETRKRMSFDTLKLIAENISFKSIAFSSKENGISSKLLLPVTAHMQEHLTPKKKTKLESMLNQIAAGIEKNPFVDPTDLFTFIYILIERGINEESAGEGTFIGGSKPHLNREVQRGKRVSATPFVKTRPACSHLITVFALDLFYKRMKSHKSDESDEDHMKVLPKSGKCGEELLSKLDPFVKLLGSCLSTKYEDILSASLRCLTKLVRLPLPSLTSQADKIKVTSLDIAESSINANSPLMESCLRLLVALLQSTRVTLSSDQLHMLIQFPLFLDLERNPSHVALSLLLAIVRRKLVVPEIYDLILRVAELMVTSQVESVQKKCSQILLQFLREYKLTDKYLDQQLKFLQKNLSYVYPSGRKAVLGMLHTIIVKLPQRFLDEHAGSLFLHLGLCLANDEDSEVRSLAATAIKLLVRHTKRNSFRSFFDISLSWYKDERSRVRSPGAQVLGLIVEGAKEVSQKHIDIILPDIEKILRSASEAVIEAPDHSDESIPYWKEAYYSLVLLEKIVKRFTELGFESKFEDLWESVIQSLVHPHTWLRNVSSRLVDLYFSTVKSRRKKGSREANEEFFLLKPSRLFQLAGSLCCQLKTRSIDEAAGEIIKKNLIFAINEIRDLVSRMEDPHALLLKEKGGFLKGFKLLDYKKGRGAFLHVICGANAEDDECDEGEGGGDVQHLLVSSLLRKLGEIALQTEDTQTKIVLDCYKSLSQQTDLGDLQHYAHDMLLLAYKVSEGFAGRVISDDVKPLAKEVYESVEKAVGNEIFVQINSKIRKSMKAKRDKRKQEEKVMAVVNPTRNAKRKLKVAAKHRANKKRKMMTMKMGRWMR